MYLRREEEKAKAKARIMVAIAKESVGASNSVPLSKVNKDRSGPPLGMSNSQHYQGQSRIPRKYRDLEFL